MRVLIATDAWSPQVNGVVRCNAGFHKGEEMGRFEHGSTILVLTPGGFSFCENVGEGALIRVGQLLMRLP